MTNTYIFAMHSIRALPEILYIMFGIGTGGFLVLLIEVKLSIFFFIQFFLFSVRRICFFLCSFSGDKDDNCSWWLTMIPCNPFGVRHRRNCRWYQEQEEHSRGSQIRSLCLLESHKTTWYWRDAFVRLVWIFFFLARFLSFFFVNRWSSRIRENDRDSFGNYWTGPETPLNPE